MSNLIKLSAIALGVLVSLSTKANGPGSNPKITAQVDSLLNLMTLEEKVGQMTQINISVLAKKYDATSIPIGNHALSDVKMKQALIDCHVGSVLNALEGRKTMDGWHEVITDIQNTATKKTRLGIPVLFGVDAIHGATYIFGSTLFPHNIGIAASRNLNHAKSCAEITAKETRASGVPWNFDPVFDIGREPLWPRFPETYGEDVHICTEFGVASVKGYEGNDISSNERVASCMKHYVGYSKPATGWDRTPASIPEIELRTHYLPQFKAAIDAGARTIMINSGEVNGIPTHVNDYLLKTVLREELGFKGLAVSDWEDIIMLHTKHKVAKTPKEAVKMAVLAGVDMSMVPMNLSFYHLLVELVKEGQVPASRIDEAVRRILYLKFELGLFENAYPDPAAMQNFKNESYKDMAYLAAAESMTLLKNEKNGTSNILPLKKEAKFFLGGPGANCKSSLHGSWSYSWQGDEEFRYPESTQTVLDAFKGEVGAENVICNSTSVYDSSANYSLTGAEKADFIILCVGENAYAETPGSIKDLTLDEKQIALVEKASKLNKPIILVLIEGRPRIIRKVVPHAKGILMAYQPGEMGAKAIVNTLFGSNNPSGKLPFTYPRSTGHRVLYDCKFSELGKEHTQAGFTYTGYHPEFEFGHGLSYSTFEISNFSVAPYLSRSGSLTVEFSVWNKSKVDGKIGLDLFIKDHFASVTPSNKKLVAFQKISVKAGEQKAVSFVLTKDDLSFIGKDLKRIVEDGKFSVILENKTQQFTLGK